MEGNINEKINGLKDSVDVLLEKDHLKVTDHNSEYEKLVAEILQGMLEFDGFENHRVEHDVTITGKSGATHQIDVYWEFKAAGITYRTCVECKNYRSAVKKSHVASFAEVLRDIGNANGIIATTSSFQKGAKLLAKENNIRLVLVNHLIKSVHYKIQPIMSDFINTRFNFNSASAKKALKRNELSRFELNFTYLGDHYLVDADGNEQVRLNELINTSTLTEGHNVVDCSHLYLDVDGLGLVQLDSIEVDMVLRKVLPIEGCVESPNSAKAVIEGIVDNNIHYLHDGGKVDMSIDRTESS